MSWASLITACVREQRPEKEHDTQKEREAEREIRVFPDKESLSSLQVWSANDMQMCVNERAPTPYNSRWILEVSEFLCLCYVWGSLGKFECF